MAVIERPGFALPRQIPLPLSGRGLVVSGLIALAFLGLLPVLQSSSATTTGFTVNELEARRDSLQDEVSTLESEVAGYASLDYVEREATERLGMTEPETRLFVSVPLAAPPLERLPTRFEPAPVEEETTGSPWWQPVADLLDFD
jgi:hypothetical protein